MMTITPPPLAGGGLGGGGPAPTSTPVVAAHSMHLADTTYIEQKKTLLTTALRRAGFTDIALSPPVAHRSRRTAPHGPSRPPNTQRRTTRPPPRAQHRHRRPHHLSRAASNPGRSTPAHARPAAPPPVIPSRGIRHRQPTRLRPRRPSSHRRPARPVGSSRTDRIRPRPRPAPHRLGTGQRRTGTNRHIASTNDDTLQHNHNPAARCLPASLRIRRGSHHRRRARPPSPPRDASPNCSQAAAQSPSPWCSMPASAHGKATHASVSALRNAATRSLAGRIEATQRDLARQPLQAKELAPFAAVVLDPPSAGAAAQVAHIAAAKVPVVIYVNCNPATLSRDARLLHQSGYRLQSATPIDQFLWSARLESVCVFTSAPAARRQTHQCHLPLSAPRRGGEAG